MSDGGLQAVADTFARIMSELEPQHSWIGFVEDGNRRVGSGDPAAAVPLHDSSPGADNLDSIIERFASRPDRDDFKKAA